MRSANAVKDIGNHWIIREKGCWAVTNPAGGDGHRAHRHRRRDGGLERLQADTCCNGNDTLSLAPGQSLCAGGDIPRAGGQKYQVRSFNNFLVAGGDITAKTLR